MRNPLQVQGQLWYTPWAHDTGFALESGFSAPSKEHRLLIEFEVEEPHLEKKVSYEAETKDT